MPCRWDWKQCSGHIARCRSGVSDRSREATVLRAFEISYEPEARARNSASYASLALRVSIQSTGRQFTPCKRGVILTNAPQFRDRSNLPVERCLHAVEHFGKRRDANRIMATSRFNATVSFVLQAMAVRLTARRMWIVCSRTLPFPFQTWMPPVSTRQVECPCPLSVLRKGS